MQPSGSSLTVALRPMLPFYAPTSSQSTVRHSNLLGTVVSRVKLPLSCLLSLLFAISNDFLTWKSNWGIPLPLSVPTTRERHQRCRRWLFGTLASSGGMKSDLTVTKERQRGVSINRRDLVAVPVPNAKLLWRDLHVREIMKSGNGQRTQNIRIDVIVEGIF